MCIVNQFSAFPISVRPGHRDGSTHGSTHRLAFRVGIFGNGAPNMLVEVCVCPELVMEILHQTFSPAWTKLFFYREAECLNFYKARESGLATPPGNTDHRNCGQAHDHRILHMGVPAVSLCQSLFKYILSKHQMTSAYISQHNLYFL